MSLQKVSAVQDGDCHWYVIPEELYDSFYKDCGDEDMCDSGEFDEKYGQYRTGGDLNNTQLWAEINQE
jgi:hypothetical protein